MNSRDAAKPFFFTKKKDSLAINIGFSMRTANSDKIRKAISRNKQDRDVSEYCEEAISFVLNKQGSDAFAIVARAKELAKQFFEKHDGLIIPGNDNNINPYFYVSQDQNQNFDLPLDLSIASNRRTLLEMELIKQALLQGKPIFGICGGHQILGVFFGAKMADVFDLASELPVSESIKALHWQQSSAEITDPIAFHCNTSIYALFKKTKKRGIQKKPLNLKNQGDISRGGNNHESINQEDINQEDIMEFEVSIHDQAIDPSSLPYSCVVAATDANDIIKAIEVKGEAWIIGTQYHPEYFHPGSDVNNAIFYEFISACRDRKSQSILKTQLHREIASLHVTAPLK
jgi:gamma-glutamyl-gamma-aminobutyrate hydrolase PuuD